MCNTFQVNDNSPVDTHCLAGGHLLNEFMNFSLTSLKMALKIAIEFNDFSLW